MNVSDLVPASMAARNLGVKSVVYGPPGCGKTPSLNTAPRPLLLACEPGLRSMAKSNVATFVAYTPQRMDEFFDWLFGSADARQFDTVGVDSISQMAEIILLDQERNSKNRDPRSWYREMKRYVYDKLSSLYLMQNKHVYLIAKLDPFETNTSPPLAPGLPSTTTTRKARPYFPGRELNVLVPHLFDEILYMDRVQHPQQAGVMVPVFRTREDSYVHARDRSGNLAELEATDLSYLFNKAMA